MLEIILNGLKLGVVLTFLVGPVFFTIIQTSVERGFWSGVMVSLGVSVSDILYVTICYFGVVQFINNPTFRLYLAYGGGSILILFGLYHIFIKSRRNLSPSLNVARERKAYRYFAKGFILNGFSPMVLIFWIGAIGVASIDFGYSKGFEFFLFFSVVLCTVLTADVLKAYLADKLRRLVTNRSMRIMNVIVGACLILFGGRLIYLADTFLS